MYSWRPIKRCLGILCLALIVLVAVPVQAAWSPAFTIDRHSIRVELASDGSAIVTETVRYLILSDIQVLDFRVMHDQGEAVQLVRVGVANMLSDDGQPIFVEAKPVDGSSNQNLPLTYTVAAADDHLAIRLSTLSKAETDRTVSLAYKINGAVEMHDDAAYFEHRFFNQNFRADAHHLALDLVLPEHLPVDRVWAKTVSHADFTMTRAGTESLRFEASDVPADQDILVACVMPTDAFTGTGIRTASPQLTWHQLIDQVHDLDSKLNWLRNLRQQAWGLVFLLLLLSIITGVGIYWFFDREGEAEYRQRYDQTIVDYLPPAIIAALLGPIKPARVILATLLDLVRRKELALDGCVFTQLHPGRTDFTGFSASEVYLLQWMFGQIARENTLSTGQIRQYARGEETADHFRAYYRQYRILFDEELRTRDLFDPKKTRRGKTLSLILACGYLVLAVLFLTSLQAPAGWLLLIPVFLLVLYSHQITRLTANGRELRAHCQALRRYMFQMTRVKDLPELDFLARALPVSIAIGSSQNFFRQIGRTWSEVGPEQLGIDGLASRGKMRSTTAQLQDLIIDLQVMESMLTASLLLADGVHL